MGKISIPHIDVDIDSYEGMIVDSFSTASVTGAQIENLKLQLNRAMTRICNKLKTEIAACKRETEEIMEEQAIVFVDNIINTLSENVSMLKERIENKEESIIRYEKLIDLLTEYVRVIKQLEM